MSVSEDPKILADALNVVKVQTVQLRRCLEAEEIMEALKAASTMLSELRTSSLSPKQYYELYMAVFDSLRYLSTYLYEAHVDGRHHLADLYELVQYAGNIVPRLYLMITVGSVYMSIPDAPVREIMKDMLEMSRGVQHPTRGLFLRHYLSGQTRDFLPVGSEDGPLGNLQDSIGFVLTNFIEMNKLWVRLQHQGHSREREKREMERRDLRILVGTNLVRLSQLEGVEVEMYQKMILPAVLEQVVNCKDVIAQEYLMEVVIQVFTDEFHLHTLPQFLGATAQLHPRVNVKQIVIALIDRLAAFAAREAENEDPDEKKRGEEEAARRLADKVKGMRIKGSPPTSPTEAKLPSPRPAEADEWANTSVADGAETEGQGSEGENKETVDESKENGGAEGEKNEEETAEPEKPAPHKLRTFRGIPEDAHLFEVFWQQIVELIKARPDLSVQDITALFVSLANLSLSCYPDRLEYIDQILSYATTKVHDYQNSPDLHAPQTTANLLALLLAPILSYLSVLTLLAIPSYIPLLSVQPYTTRASIGQAVVSSVLKNDTLIETTSDVEGVLGLCAVLVRDQKDSASGAPRHARQPIDLREMAEEQGWVARMVHLFRSEDLHVQFDLLQTANKLLAEGGERIRWTFPPLIASSIQLARRFKTRQPDEKDWEQRVTSLFKFIHRLISILYTKVEAPETCLQLFLLAGQVADDCGLEELAYEFFVQAFVIYEESISESRAQLQAITGIISALQSSRVFGPDNYDTLITKAALHGSKLLKKSHQATAVLYASHMWWQTDEPGRERHEVNKPLRDGKRVLECLQKSLRIATGCIDELTSVQLYVDALDRYIYYFEQGVEAVTPKYINSLVELITSNIDAVHSTDVHPASASPPGLIDGINTPDMIVKHFTNTLRCIRNKQTLHAQRREPEDEEDGEERPLVVDWSAVDVVGGCLKMGIA
ncbi:hypothetical protein CcaverHIS002_0403030 [Cutaneotrichosporon cavernicola]|uniref:Vacuolar protein sorting-associated protein 35 n=1 Tax=Cutaneotrichosporon cavernicola TaxID=279322 RepID=A0AA48L3V3_9TREE|nr:uncharacterized protein CcaverHIS019_0402990 [Cutaneotrichosporon cavernicola]BEI83699.1 hypothetical protein CcaverHIS002_0403030 [Cutaneotrichosporon cavernicola]BEI91479.1 hypothetical protein CcaverHIS019_0402990 [Cutaneotrichosporon cavernicola]BEJ07031.1 hypothetical protein CcaverHIS641_0403000 [Cutaneotrichosporon cavernicola]